MRKGLITAAAVILFAQNIFSAQNEYLGTPASEKAAENALEWLAKNQEKDGSYGKKIQLGTNPAIVGFAGLAFLAGGSVPGRGKYSENVKKIGDFLVSKQRPDGLIGQTMYEHGFSTVAMCELYGMTRKEEYKGVVQNAVNLILSCQNAKGGWRYSPRIADDDVTVTSCQVQALRAARDVGIVIFDKASIEGKELREIYETRNSRNVVDMVLRKHFDIVESDVIKMHHLLMKDIDPRKGYKKLPNVIFHQEKQVETTKPENVQKEMKSLIEWYDKNKGSMHPLELAAVFHGKFEKIHPFEDGNGRVGRFLINVILVNSGYPPLIVRKTNRMAYMKCLEAFDSGYEDRLKRFVLSKFKDTFAKFFEVYVKYA